MTPFEASKSVRPCRRQTS